MSCGTHGLHCMVAAEANGRHSRAEGRRHRHVRLAGRRSPHASPAVSSSPPLLVSQDESCKTSRRTTSDCVTAVHVSVNRIMRFSHECSWFRAMVTLVVVIGKKTRAASPPLSKRTCQLYRGVVLPPPPALPLHNHFVLPSRAD